MVTGLKQLVPPGLALVALFYCRIIGFLGGVLALCSGLYGRGARLSQGLLCSPTRFAAAVFTMRHILVVRFDLRRYLMIRPKQDLTPVTRGWNGHIRIDGVFTRRSTTLQKLPGHLRSVRLVSKQ
ncbi:hypothetical protein O9929_19570 [Vibrio lentus]|nr:hypothetical protein [Vibrio lentus]